jgi:hypothetical protein
LTEKWKHIADEIQAQVDRKWEQLKEYCKE